jgi:hypothetical protein
MIGDKKIFLKKNKKYKITRQYKQISNEFNPVSLKARCYLNQINNFLRENEKDNKISIKNKENDNIDFENINNNNQLQKKDQEKIEEFVCPSEIKFKKFKKYQQCQKNKFFKEKGFLNYIERMKPNSRIVYNLKNVINEKFTLSYDFYIFPKIEKKKADKPNKKNILKEIDKEKDNNTICNNSKSKTFIYSDNNYKTNGFDYLKKSKKNDLTFNKKKTNRVISAPKIEWRKKLQNLQKNTKNVKNTSVNEVNSKISSDRPLTSLIKSNSLMQLSSSTKDLFCSNSIWRLKKISDLIPKTNFIGLEILNNFKQKRKEIIYKRQNSLPYNYTFVSNRLICDNDFFVY